MATVWKSASKESNNTFSGTTLSSWSRQQKLAMISGFVILGLLLAMSACSKQASKPALVGVSNSTQPSSTPAPTARAAASTTPAQTAPVTPKKKTHKKRPANVTYNEPNYGVSFNYPRKYELSAGDKAMPALAELGPVPMNFVQPGGVAVATVTLPEASYPGTDFSTAFFNVNVNRGISEQQCSQFAVVDHRNPDGEPMDPEQVEVGSKKFSKTADFSGSMMKQAEAEYYHSYENGACYEFVLGLGTEGFGAKEGIEPVKRDEVFAKLEKILATVKINQVEQQQLAVKTETTTEQPAK